ncbi:hypothetical protein A2V49_02765 [candidate division WWE3 bacterium RBG_19FT_COMBO_34_6]|uniref:VanZ-like domain-containing protein n=1 Tax=candidate division WWE3 bacterium RBG_19FT_COMBO_34_6 TaxID=1802612 RepID=A0A1F4UN67_UNCKA|nr:MAG: hypothetical protein A2V49_02765 [candidate division WWE3 bacterium RBG_19FT_COMBO_34_6]
MKNLLRWVPAVVVMIFIYLVSGTSGSTIQSAGLGNEALHIIGHFFIFVTLYISYYFATKKLFLSLILAVLYGLFDEYHQKFIYLRSPSLFDIKINTFGAVSGLILCKLSQKLHHEKSNKNTN